MSLHYANVITYCYDVLHYAIVRTLHYDVIMLG